MRNSNRYGERPSFIRTPDAVDLFFRDWGTGTPLLFLAGWTLTSDMWAYQMLPLSKQGFRCVALDRRAHGRSSDPGRGFDYDTLADDIEALLDALDLTGVTIVSHSFSSAEAVRYLSRHGSKRIARLLLLAPAATPYLTKTADNPIGIDKALADEVRRGLGLDFPTWCLANSEPYFVCGTSRAVVDWTIGMMTQASLLAATELSRIQFATDFRTELGRIEVPTLVVHGDRDVSAPLELTGRPTSAAIPGARLEVYEGAPHGLYFTHQERLNKDIASFAREAR